MDNNIIYSEHHALRRKIDLLNIKLEETEDISLFRINLDAKYISLILKDYQNYDKKLQAFQNAVSNCSILTYSGHCSKNFEPYIELVYAVIQRFGKNIDKSDIYHGEAKNRIKSIYENIESTLPHIERQM